MPKNNSKTPTRQSFTFTDPTAGKDYSMNQGFKRFTGDYGTSAGVQDMRVNLPSMPTGSGVSTSIDGIVPTSSRPDYRTEAQKVRQEKKAERVEKRQTLRNKKQAARIEKRTKKFEDKQKELNNSEGSPANFLGLSNALAGVGSVMGGNTVGVATDPSLQALQNRGGVLANAALAAQRSAQPTQAQQVAAASAAAGGTMGAEGQNPTGGSVMPAGGGKFQLTPVAMSYDPPLQANEKGGKKSVFNMNTKGMAEAAFGTPAMRQASVGAAFQMKNIPEGDEGKGLRSLPNEVVKKMGYDPATKQK